MDLNLLCFLLLGVLLTGYAILDGFDLGVGIIYLFAGSDDDRRTLLNSIGPLWDGNEVWLVTFGGALFAAFPRGYATVLSGFYMIIVLILVALVFRAVSIEFRGKHISTIWRSFFDSTFFLGSALATWLFGFAVGNSMMGVPLTADGEIIAEYTDLIRPFPILVGFFAMSLFALHGAIYAYLKTEGALQKRIHGWIRRASLVFLVLFVATTLFAVIRVPSATHNFRAMPWAWGIVALDLLAVGSIPIMVHNVRARCAFAASSCSIAALVTLFLFSVYPNLVVSSIDPAWNLTIYTAAASEHTLEIITVFACIGMPFVLAYTFIVYWVFRGKVKLGKESY